MTTVVNLPKKAQEFDIIDGSSQFHEKQKYSVYCADWQQTDCIVLFIRPQSQPPQQQPKTSIGSCSSPHR
jgi:hypothetical protein